MATTTSMEILFTFFMFIVVIATAAIGVVIIKDIVTHILSVKKEDDDRYEAEVRASMKSAAKEKGDEVTSDDSSAIIRVEGLETSCKWHFKPFLPLSQICPTSTLSRIEFPKGDCHTALAVQSQDG